MYIYVMRHGTTSWNTKRKMLSRTDIDLDDEGIEECIKMREIVNNLDYDLVFSSPMTRTRHTLEIVNKKKCDVILDDRLKERDAREIEGEDNIDFNSYWTIGKDREYNSETIEECRKRVFEFLDELKEKYGDKNILIVTHNGICRMINIYFNGFPKTKNLYNLGQDNASIKIYEMK